jgi:biotin synthase-like enzyme
LFDDVSTDYFCKGVAVGVGEVEESTIKDLEKTRRELQGVIVALAEAKEENHHLRLKIAKLEGHDGTPVANFQPVP